MTFLTVRISSSTDLQSTQVEFQLQALPSSTPSRLLHCNQIRVTIDRAIRHLTFNYQSLLTCVLLHSISASLLSRYKSCHGRGFGVCSALLSLPEKLPVRVPPGNSVLPPTIEIRLVLIRLTVPPPPFTELLRGCMIMAVSTRLAAIPETAETRPLDEHPLWDAVHQQWNRNK